MPRRERQRVDLSDVAEAVEAANFIRSSRGKPGKPTGTKEELRPLERRYVEAVVLGAPSQRAAAEIAGYADPQADAYAVAARPRVQAAIEERRTEMQQRANVNIARVWAQLQSYALDDRTEVRGPAVRSAELLLRGAGELDTRVQVTVDARSALLPGVDATQAQAALERMFVDTTVLESTDAGTE